MTDPLPKPRAFLAQPDEMTVTEVARRMGYHPQSVYKLCKENILPYTQVRPKAPIRFSREQMAQRFPNTKWYD